MCLTFSGAVAICISVDITVFLLLCFSFRSDSLSDEELNGKVEPLMKKFLKKLFPGPKLTVLLEISSVMI